MSFPSLTITKDRLRPEGEFARAQAQFLYPQSEDVKILNSLLKKYRIGVVSHFYMDAELQGILSACEYEHIHIADSLLMADRAVQMAEAGVQSIVVLGVDFMSENVRAVVDAAGYSHIPVYRVDHREIGCSLAESAEARAYGAWLEQAKSTSKNPLHVIYINTSLQVKAHAHTKVPTITCTSSNVVQTILQADAQISDLSVWYGPDTYMGQNLTKMFEQFQSQLSDEEIAAKIHPQHNRQSIQRLLENFHVFPQGNCVVHHMFGLDVVEQVRRDYPEAYYTAHLEVPGEMFELAVDAQRRGRGVIGSTSNILQFILEKVAEAETSISKVHIPVVLGTESGMVTSIVRKVQQKLQEINREDISVEIIFPVASEAVAQDDTFGIIPGVAGGEGCSTAGGCATCPYMKMNSLEALEKLVESIGIVLEDGKDIQSLQKFHPKAYSELLDGKTIAEVGGEPILHMRHFQSKGILPQELVNHVIS